MRSLYCCAVGQCANGLNWEYLHSVLSLSQRCRQFFDQMMGCLITLTTTKQENNTSSGFRSKQPIPSNNQFQNKAAPTAPSQLTCKGCGVLRKQETAYSLANTVDNTWAVLLDRFICTDMHVCSVAPPFVVRPVYSTQRVNIIIIYCEILFLGTFHYWLEDP
jgi:hypothetical protein